MIHTGEKPFLCFNCDYRSNTKYGLKFIKDIIIEIKNKLESEYFDFAFLTSKNLELIAERTSFCWA